jgi:hypothetical protein
LLLNGSKVSNSVVFYHTVLRITITSMRERKKDGKEKMHNEYVHYLHSSEWSIRTGWDTVGKLHEWGRRKMVRKTDHTGIHDDIKQKAVKWRVPSSTCSKGGYLWKQQRLFGFRWGREYPTLNKYLILSLNSHPSSLRPFRVTASSTRCFSLTESTSTHFSSIYCSWVSLTTCKRRAGHFFLRLESHLTNESFKACQS